jgi:hypothetical protein
LEGGLNLYGFANGDPINFADPLGLQPQWLVSGLARIGPAVASAVRWIATQWDRLRGIAQSPAAIQGAQQIAGAGQLFGNALKPYKGGSLTQAGRALTKHPEVLGYTKETLRTVLRTDPEINAAAARVLEDILRGTQTAVTLPRFGTVIQFRGASGFGARFYAETGHLIGFINP